jgi:hypothetical protein
VPWIFVDSPVEVVIRAPEVVDTLNVIAELSRGRHRKTKRSREVDELIVAAHQTMDTEQAAANALQEAARRTTRPKAAALMAEMQASRELMAQAILKAC